MPQAAIEPKTVEEYIAGFPTGPQGALKKMRAVMRKTVPYAPESIAYKMPAYALKGGTLYFAGWKNHLGLYGAASAIAPFRRELATYEIAKGSIRFPFRKRIPFDLIERIVLFCKDEFAKRPQKDAAPE